MPVDIESATYFTVGEVANMVGRNRTTLWRWRQQHRIPLGRKYCDNQVLYSAEEVALVFSYAHRLKPVDAKARLCDQLSLFSSSPR